LKFLGFALIVHVIEVALDVSWDRGQFGLDATAHTHTLYGRRDSTEMTVQPKALPIEQNLRRDDLPFFAHHGDATGSEVLPLPHIRQSTLALSLDLVSRNRIPAREVLSPDPA
jgi:hypothetical protein